MKFLARHIPDINLNSRLLGAVFIIVALFALGFPYPIFFGFGQALLLLVIVLSVIDVVVLYFIKQPLSAERIMDEKLSNGDFNPVILKISGSFNFDATLKIIDEFPLQLQIRDTVFYLQGKRFVEKEIIYQIKPIRRGVYKFGKLHVFVSTFLGLINRRISLDLSKNVKVYPSFIQFKKYSFLAINNRLQEAGVKRTRQIGQSQEFEQIKEYVRGDDFRKINWRATARKNDLMVNQHQEEKAQNVYCLIDKGRLMQMPFDGLNLIDYAINSTLVVSGIAIGRGDKAGLVTFSNRIGSFIPAQSLPKQMHHISEALYNEKVEVIESDFLGLYKNVKYHIRKRSLLLMYSNFDSLISLKRQIKYLKAIGKEHLLCVVIFDNTEVNKMANTKAFRVQDTYQQTVAEKLQFDKKLIIKELNKNGIYSILTEPQDLTINTINKYIELKARGLL